MRRLLALPAVVALLALSTALPVSAAVQRDTWDKTYTLTATDFCGFAVTVHDYGSNNYFQVSEDGWTWAKHWEGTLAYTNGANDKTASMVWSWMTTQSVASRTDTTINLVVTSHGTIRVIAANGRVVESNSGQETFERDLVLVGQAWIDVTTDDNLSVKGPHPMDYGNGFCDAISPLLNPGG